MRAVRRRRGERTTGIDRRATGEEGLVVRNCFDVPEGDQW
jgi:hypothetical protein